MAECSNLEDTMAVLAEVIRLFQEEEDANRIRHLNNQKLELKALTEQNDQKLKKIIKGIEISKLEFS